MEISLKFEITAEKTRYGKKTGRYLASIGNVDFAADSKDALKEQMRRGILEMSRSPQVGHSKVGAEYLFCVSHNGSTDTYRPHDYKTQGVSILRNTSASSHDIVDEVESNAIHLAQGFWTPEMGEDETARIESLLPESKQSDFRSWVRYQREYAETGHIAELCV